MMMIVDVTDKELSFSEVVDELGELGKGIGVDIRLQREDIFDSMHRV